MRTRTRVVATRFLAVLIGGLIITVCFAAVPRLIGASPAQAEGLTPSARTISFIAAYESGDELTADALASPLYRAEWARRGVGASERMALRGIASAVPTARAGLRFEYVGGIRSSEGFSHLLYAVRPIREGRVADGAYSVWRVDVEPEGRVIWLELVWLFGPDTTAIIRMGDAGSLAGVPVPAQLARAGIVPVVGVASATTGEGHYVLGTWAGVSGWSEDAAVRTYGVDCSGAIRPGAWSFGTGDSGVSPYPPSRAPRAKIEVATEYEPLLEAYRRAVAE